MIERFDLLVFDWDGTLMDSEARITSCLRAAATDTGLPARSDEALREVIGLGLREALSHLFENIDEPTLQQLTAAYRQHFLYDNPTPSALFPGAADMIRHLHAQGFRLAIATGKARQGLDRVLAETGLGDYFHASRCADETGSKPHPRMLLEIMQQLGIAPERTLMVGDTEFDLAMAANAGVAGVAVGYGVHAVSRLLAMQPLTCVGNIAELAAWLESGETPGDVVASA